MNFLFRTVEGTTALHRSGDEGAWWKNAGIDPLGIARKLWKHTLLNLKEGRDQSDI